MKKKISMFGIRFHHIFTTVIAVTVLHSIALEHIYIYIWISIYSRCMRLVCAPHKTIILYNFLFVGSFAHALDRSSRIKWQKCVVWYEKYVNYTCNSNPDPWLNHISLSLVLIPLPSVGLIEYAHATEKRSSKLVTWFTPASPYFFHSLSLSLAGILMLKDPVDFKPLINCIGIWHKRNAWPCI